MNASSQVPDSMIANRTRLPAHLITTDERCTVPGIWWGCTHTLEWRWAPQAGRLPWSSAAASRSRRARSLGATSTGVSSRRTRSSAPTFHCGCWPQVLQEVSLNLRPRATLLLTSKLYNPSQFTFLPPLTDTVHFLPSFIVCDLPPLTVHFLPPLTVHFFTTPHSSFFTTPHSSFFTTLIACDLPPLIVYFFTTPHSSFFTTHHTESEIRWGGWQ